MKKSLKHISLLLLGGLLLVGTSSCSKDDDDDNGPAAGCCSFTVDLGFLGSSSSIECKDGTSSVNGDDTSTGTEYTDEEWDDYAASLEELGYTCN